MGALSRMAPQSHAVDQAGRPPLVRRLRMDTSKTLPSVPGLHFKKGAKATTRQAGVAQPGRALLKGAQTPRKRGVMGSKPIAGSLILIHLPLQLNMIALD